MQSKWPKTNRGANIAVQRDGPMTDMDSPCTSLIQSHFLTHVLILHCVLPIHRRVYSGMDFMCVQGGGVSMMTGVFRVMTSYRIVLV